MLEEHLDRFGTDETSVILSFSQTMSMENPAVSPVFAKAIRVGEDSPNSTAASLRGSLTYILEYDKDAVLDFMDEDSDALESAGTTVYDAADEAWASHILFIETVESFGSDRGTGLGLMLVGATLETISAGRIVTAVLEACPLYPDRMTPAEADDGRRKLFAHWAKLGFVRVSPASRYMSLTTENYRTPTEVIGTR